MFIVALIIFGLVCVKHDTRHEVSSFLKLANVFSEWCHRGQSSRDQSSVLQVADHQAVTGNRWL